MEENCKKLRNSVKKLRKLSQKTVKNEKRTKLLKIMIQRIVQVLKYCGKIMRNYKTLYRIAKSRKEITKYLSSNNEQRKTENH